MDLVLQCTTHPIYLDFSQKEFVSFLMKIKHISIDSLTEIVGIEKVAVRSSLRLLKPKRTIETSKYGESDASTLEDPILQAGNLIKEILLKLNLPDHGLVLTEPKNALLWLDDIETLLVTFNTQLNIFYSLPDDETSHIYQ
ncbi:hypothetical protein Tco_0872478 [Tanacetum coccineum]